MTRIDRYMLGRLVAAFCFFALIFTGVVWLTQAVRLVDAVVASGEGARLFLEFSALVLPQVLVIVLPLSALGATLHALNRLYADSELVVMMAAGLGPPGLFRPLVVFGLGVAAAAALVMWWMVPLAGGILSDKRAAIRSDLANALIVERQFLHPLGGLTLFIEDTSRAGEMGGIFLHDQRDPEQVVTYSAEQALLVREGDEARLVMLDGLALSAGSDGTSLNTVAFDQFVFDLSEIVRDEGARVLRPSEYPVAALLAPTPAMLATDRYSVGDYVSEGHYKIAMPLLSLLYPVVAAATFLAGGFRRSGFGRRVVVAIAVAALSQVLLFGARAQVQGAPGLWPLVYLPHVLALAYAGVLVRRLGRPGRRRGVAAA